MRPAANRRRPADAGSIDRHGPPGEAGGPAGAAVAPGRVAAVADTLWAALALVLVVEGLMPFIAPRAWREAFRRLTEMSDGQLRFIGLASMTLGAVALLVVTHA